MVLPVPAGARWVLLCLAMMFLLSGAMAFTVTSVSVSPADVLNPGDPVNISCMVYVASGIAFPSYDDLQFVSELDDPVWSYTIIVNGVENVRPAERGKIQTISGFELGYQNRDEVIVKMVLTGRVPGTAPQGSNILLFKVQELDARSNVIPSSVVRTEHLVGQPTPTPTPAFGSIAVSSSPAGASVYLDNAIKGITPVTLEGVPNGAHNLLLRLDGYQDYTSAITVMAGQQPVSASLIPKTATASPTISPYPQTTPVTGSSSSPQPTSTPAAGTGSLSVTTTPSGAIVYIDGQMKGITPATIPGLSVGSHTIVLVMDGYEEFKTTTEISPGTSSEFITGLAKKKQAPGFAFAGAIVAVGFIALALIRMRKNE
jgi:hypothetical protein